MPKSEKFFVAEQQRKIPCGKNLCVGCGWSHDKCEKAERFEHCHLYVTAAQQCFVEAFCGPGAF
jgi:hypothetical protein